MAGLMGFVGLLAVGLAALKSANKSWAGAVTMLVLGVLLLAGLGVLHSAGPMRRFWSGFAVFGWAYLVFVYAPWFNKNVSLSLHTDELLQWLHSKMANEQGPATDSETIAIWVKSNGNYWVDGQEVADEPSLTEHWVKAASGKATPSYVRFYFDRGSNDRTAQPEIQRLLGLFGQTGSSTWHSNYLPLKRQWDYFRQVGQCLVALLAGLIGGLLGLLVFRGQPDARRTAK